MRKRDRDVLLERMDKEPDVKQGRPICIRPYQSDEKRLEEIATETGEGKATLVRRMIRFALADKQHPFAADPCRDKLDWLIKNGRGESHASGESDRRIDEVLERLQALESTAETAADISRNISHFLREIYCMSAISLSSQNLIFTRLLEFASPRAEEREQSGIVAARALANQIAQAVKDLSKFTAFLDTRTSRNDADDLFLLTKIKAIRDLISEKPSGKL